MDKNAVLDIIQRYAAALVDQGVQPEKIILYGSYARGDWHEWSDIDLVVISKDFENMGYWKRIDVLSEGIFQIREPIESVAMTPAEWKSGKSLIVDFAKEGELAYTGPNQLASGVSVGGIGAAGGRASSP